VATPAGILDALSYYRAGPLDGIRTVTVVDPTRIEALLEVMTPLIERQIQGADDIVITKLDEAGPEEVELARRAVERLHPGAPIWKVSAGEETVLAPVLRALADGAGS
jgi:G3E family GTPase